MKNPVNQLSPQMIVLIKEKPTYKTTILLFTLWAIAIGLALFVCLWPIYKNIVIYNDAFCYLYTDNPTFGVLLIRFWNFINFRISAMIGGMLCNPLTRDARLVMLIQIPALTLSALALWVGVSRVCRSDRLWLYPIALSLYLLHTSTSVTMWQMGLACQTWAAVFGLWLGILLWDTFQAILNKSRFSGLLLIVFLLCLFGVNIKEIFYGWCVAGIGITVLCWFYLRKSLTWGQTRQFAVLLTPLIIIPVLHFFLRFRFGGIGAYFQIQEGPYRPSTELNLITNMGISFLGLFATGPMHYLRFFDSPALKALPLLSIGGFMLIALIPWILPISLKSANPARGKGLLLAAIFIYTFLGVSATLPTQHISEEYLAGPSAGSVLLMAIGILCLIRLLMVKPSALQFRRLSILKPFLFILLLVVCGLSLLGLVSRARHTAISWEYGRVLCSLIQARQQQLPDSAVITTLYIPDDAWKGRMYSHIVMPATQALNAPATEIIQNKMWPTRKIALRPCSTASTQPGNPVIIDISILPPRPKW